MQARVTSSTSMRSTLVWSICTTCSGRSVRKPGLTWRNWLLGRRGALVGLHPLAQARAETRALTAFSDGAVSPAGMALPSHLAEQTCLIVVRSGRR